MDRSTLVSKLKELRDNGIPIGVRLNSKTIDLQRAYDKLISSKSPKKKDGLNNSPNKNIKQPVVNITEAIRSGDLETLKSANIKKDKLSANRLRLAGEIGNYNVFKYLLDRYEPDVDILKELVNDYRVYKHPDIFLEVINRLPNTSIDMENLVSAVDSKSLNLLKAVVEKLNPTFRDIMDSKIPERIYSYYTGNYNDGLMDDSLAYLLEKGLFNPYYISPYSQRGQSLIYIIQIKYQTLFIRLLSVYPFTQDQLSEFLETASVGYIKELEYLLDNYNFSDEELKEVTDYALRIGSKQAIAEFYKRGILKSKSPRK